ncbi:uncharacterized protein SAPINGB_P004598 [Magnusiomyces paraingens]|uniref:Asparaginase n=1 Tax=Magnusiomyces paraingens TaxID=2606893 RepID=A0A5E8BWF2_9ASCO|nr:uncharacterized protein SAPINGB_P004598 [Saprochaete ingens]VVT55441.1 unnamed protein product [Saprochaete ingens]
MQSPQHAVFIALHVGAGNHGSASEKHLKKLCKSVCSSGLAQLNTGANALDVAVRACSLLEDSPYTNAGFGAQLNEEGQVECDACIMDNRGKSAAVGAVRHARNAVEVCGEMLRDLIDPARIKDPLGRVRPALLVGAGADKYAAQHGCLLVTDEADLVTDRSLREYLELKRYLRKTEGVQDTVGVICGDVLGNVVTCASSGGIALKVAGRVGPAGIVGAGVYAGRGPGTVTAAACTSGTGEDIMTVQAARVVCDRLCTAGPDGVNAAWLEKNLIQPESAEAESFQRGPRLYFGVLTAFVSGPGAVEIGFAHTTEAMILGYAVAGGRGPVAEVSRNEKGSNNLVFGGYGYESGVTEE